MATRKQDVGLLFGMEGGGALSGKTGKLIQDQLTELVKKLNEDKRVAKRGLVFSLNIAETRRRLKLDLTNLLTELNSKKDISKGLKITISEFNAKPALKKLQEQVASVLEGKIVAGDVSSGTKSSSGKTSSASRTSAAVSSTNDSMEQELVSMDLYYREYDRISKKIEKAQKQQNSWTAAAFGSTREMYAARGREIEKMSSLLNELDPTTTTTKDFNRISNEIKKASHNIREYDRAIIAAGKNTKSIKDRLTELAEKFTLWDTARKLVTFLYKEVKKMVDAVRQIDTAMTELRKVTDETASTYDTFLSNAANRAKQLGTTISDVVTATADFARLGYSLDEASSLADAAIIYKNVGDGINNITEATESIISTMKAFGIEAENAMMIVDKFNEVGNNFAISSVGIGEALKKSASALASANNELNESIALVTAANSVIQNPETVGTALKTISMFIRAAKVEAEEAGESTDGMANSVSELRESILALTGNKVDIQINDSTFKSTYQVLKELSDVWDELSNIDQSAIIELIGGKRNANVITSLLSNFDVAENVLKTAANATGSALAENEKYLDSIEGKISKFKASYQELSTTLINSDLVKAVVDFGTELLNLANSIAEFTNKLGGLPTIITGVIGALSVKNALNGFSSVSSVIDAIKGLFSASNAANGAAAIANSISDVADASDDLITSVSGVSAYAAQGAAATQALGAASTTTATGVNTLNASLSATKLVLGGVIIAITLAVAAWSAYRNSVKEARQEAINESNESAKSLGDVVSAYNESKEAISLYDQQLDVSDESQRALIDSTQDLIDKLGVEENQIDSLIKKYGSYKNAILELINAKIADARTDAISGMNAAEKNLNDFVNTPNPFAYMSERTVNTSASDAAYRSAKDLIESSKYTSSYSSSVYSDNINVQLGAGDGSVEDARRALESYRFILDKLERAAISDSSITSTDLYKKISSFYTELSTYVKEYTSQENNKLMVDVFDAIQTQSSRMSKMLGRDLTVDDKENLAMYVRDYIGYNSKTEAQQSVLDGFIRSYIDAHLPSKEKQDGPGASYSGVVKEIDSAYDALKRLESVQLRIASIESELNKTDDLERYVDLTKELVAQYELEKEALEYIINANKAKIASKSASLAKAGIGVSYDDVTNQVVVNNQEVLSGMSEDMANDYQKIIDDIDKLAKENQEYAKQIIDGSDKIISQWNEVISKGNSLVDTAQNVYSTLSDAANEYAETGLLSVDSLQSILELGPKYLDYLTDENGMLVMDKKAVEDLIKARTEEMVVTSALSYAKQIQAAVDADNINLLKELTGQTIEATDTTWGMVYSVLQLAKVSGLAKGWSHEIFDDAHEQIKKMEALSKTAANSVGQYYANLSSGQKSQKDNIQTIFELTQEMVEWEKDQKIKAIEDELDKYREIIEAKKEMLDLTKEEEDYEKSIAEKLEEASKLQNQIDLLSLDDSREAAAKRAGLEVELGELLGEIGEMQADHSLEIQQEALDKELENYEKGKDAEIEALEESLNSAEKLYQATITRIQEGWDSLYQDLVNWNTNYGNTLQKDLESAWNSAYAAAQRYGSFTGAMNADGTTVGSSATSGAPGYTTGAFATGNTPSGTDKNVQVAADNMKANSLSWWAAADQSVYANANQEIASKHNASSDNKIEYRDGTWYGPDGKPLYTLTRDEVGNAVVSQMKANSALWGTAGADNAKLEDHNQILANRLSEYLGQPITKDGNGVWWLGNQKLYDIKKFHSGGAVGRSTLKQDEVLAILKEGESVIDESRAENMYKAVDIAEYFSKKFGKSINLSKLHALVTGRGGYSKPGLGLIPGIGNNGETSMVFSPHVEVHISHNGSMSEADAARYGRVAANSALSELKEAFTKRGVSSIGNAILK